MTFPARKKETIKKLILVSLAVLFMRAQASAYMDGITSFPAGSTGTVQFNDVYFQGTTNFIYNKATQNLSVTSITATNISGSFQGDGTKITGITATVSITTTNIKLDALAVDTTTLKAALVNIGNGVEGSVIYSGSFGLDADNTTTTYFMIGCCSGNGNDFSMIATKSGTIKKLYVSAVANTTDADTQFMVSKNDSLQPIVATMPAFSTTASDVSHSFNVSPGDKLSFADISPGATTGHFTNIKAAVLFESPAAVAGGGTALYTGSQTIGVSTWAFVGAVISYNGSFSSITVSGAVDLSTTNARLDQLKNDTSTIQNAFASYTATADARGDTFVNFRTTTDAMVGVVDLTTTNVKLDALAVDTASLRATTLSTYTAFQVHRSTTDGQILALHLDTGTLQANAWIAINSTWAAFNNFSSTAQAVGLSTQNMQTFLTGFTSTSDARGNTFVNFRSTTDSQINNYITINATNTNLLNSSPTVTGSWTFASSSTTFVNIYASTISASSVTASNFTAIRSTFSDMGIDIGAATFPTLWGIGSRRTGWYQPAANQWAFTASGSQQFTLFSGGITLINGTILGLPLGSVTAPAFTVGSQTGSGIFGEGGPLNAYGFASNGKEQMKFFQTGQMTFGRYGGGLGTPQPPPAMFYFSTATTITNVPIFGIASGTIATDNLFEVTGNSITLQDQVTITSPTGNFGLSVTSFNAGVQYDHLILSTGGGIPGYEFSPTSFTVRYATFYLTDGGAFIQGSSVASQLSLNGGGGNHNYIARFGPLMNGSGLSGASNVKYYLTDNNTVTRMVLKNGSGETELGETSTPGGFVGTSDNSQFSIRQNDGDAILIDTSKNVTIITAGAKLTVGAASAGSSVVDVVGGSITSRGGNNGLQVGATNFNVNSTGLGGVSAGTNSVSGATLRVDGTFSNQFGAFRVSSGPADLMRVAGSSAQINTFLTVSSFTTIASSMNITTNLTVNSTNFVTFAGGGVDLATNTLTGTPLYINGQNSNNLGMIRVSSSGHTMQDKLYLDGSSFTLSVSLNMSSASLFNGFATFQSSVTANSTVTFTNISTMIFTNSSLDVSQGYIAFSTLTTPIGAQIAVQGAGLAVIGASLTIQNPYGFAVGTAVVIQQGAGNVGIGTVSPTAKLHIVGGTDYGETISGGNLGNLKFGSGGVQGALSYDTGKSIVYALSGNDLSLGSNGAYDQLYIKSGGNVGIGTTAPRAALDTNQGGALLGGTTVASGAGASGLSITQNWKIRRENASTGDLYIDNDGATRLEIQPTGNIGIGTVVPGALLNVYGGNIWLNKASGTPLFLNGLDAQNYVGLSYHIDTSPRYADIQSFASNAVAQLCLNPSGGSVGVGTTNPSTTLEVNGILKVNAQVRLKGYTVAGLPAGTQGDTAFVTDALTPAFGTAVVGGGAVVIPVFYNGTTWVSY